MEAKSKWSEPAASGGHSWDVNMAFRGPDLCPKPLH